MRMKSPMKRTRHSEATVEIHEVVIVRGSTGAGGSCDQCAPGIGRMMSPEAAASITGIPVRTLFRCLEAGLIHYREIENGAVLVCVNSLPRGGTPVDFTARR
jgi:hypothetical protein